MRGRPMSVGLAMLLALGGCVPVAIHPFFADEDWVADPRIEGVWVNQERDKRFAIEKRGHRTYRLEESAHTPGDTASARLRTSLEVHAADVSGQRLLDLGLAEIHSDDWTLWAHVIPGHTAARVQAAGDTLRLSLLSDEWLRLRLDAGAVSTPHLVAGQRLVLTGDTRELRGLMEALADSDQAFSVEVELYRVPAAAP